ncbi:MAG TPA: hypothetical protein VES73_01275 [Lamprocystis sp. (in: g-proteobacteria)]|nr:hypothetical protein [Lamprocystis sp. (in: g-proteobacteria)]
MSTHQAAAHLSTGRLAAGHLAILLGAFTFGASAVFAGDSRIELRDGSVVSGELVSVTNGMYRIRSRNLGEIQVREADVMAVRPGSTAAEPVAAPTSPRTEIAGPGANLAGIQQQLLGNPQTMAAITQLQNDPAITSALSDPEFARLILSGDVEKLRSDPRFQRLLENPAIQAIVGQVLGR